MTTLTQLTDNSWIIKTKDTFGILFFNKNHYTIKTVTSSIDYDNLDLIEKKYGKISYVERSTEEIKDNIDGYPVKDKNYSNLETTPPSYVKVNSYSKSNIPFYAGYWSIKYPNGWNINLCPKVSTTEQYKVDGPFRTKLECVNNNNLLNTRINLENG